MDLATLFGKISMYREVPEASGPLAFMAAAMDAAGGVIANAFVSEDQRQAVMAKMRGGYSGPRTQRTKADVDPGQIHNGRNMITFAPPEMYWQRVRPLEEHFEAKERKERLAAERAANPQQASAPAPVPAAEEKPKIQSFRTIFAPVQPKKEEEQEEKPVVPVAPVAPVAPVVVPESTEAVIDGEEITTAPVAEPSPHWNDPTARAATAKRTETILAKLGAAKKKKVSGMAAEAVKSYANRAPALQFLANARTVAEG